MEIGQSFGAVKYILNITYVTNTGAAFGILKDHRWIFIIFSMIAIGAMLAILAYFIRKKQHIGIQISFALMVSGGIGNMIDRLYYGYVIDFLEFDFVNFAIFNVADSCITIGCAIFIIFMFIERNSVFGDGASKDSITESEEPDTGDGI
jgi:signal peptidase II